MKTKELFELYAKVTTDESMLSLYKKSLAQTEEEIAINKEYYSKRGEYPLCGNEDFVAKLESNAIWYREKIEMLEKKINEI